MAVMGDRVPMFKLRPYHSLLIAALFFAIVGGLLSAYFMVEDAYESEARRGLFSLIVTGILVLILVIAAFSRYRFSHLKHHRPGYKRG
ncbi:hypothetical protein [Tichowtungia aerotolerans]|uniref:Uncharacterized protein n=1 Tax=Tichowtungia aerotolerans TaxID=2697043 RepID=A0A6P1M3T7_9BACT|nr:hypothetical protein [Tichowtungia aerotolerans]QHI69270.1 hypothetical protein GT409_07340 [Tichowtungia aerotolerans]